MKNELTINYSGVDTVNSNFTDIQNGLNTCVYEISNIRVPSDCDEKHNLKSIANTLNNLKKFVEDDREWFNNKMQSFVNVDATNAETVEFYIKYYLTNEYGDHSAQDEVVENGFWEWSTATIVGIPIGYRELGEGSLACITALASIISGDLSGVEEIIKKQGKEENEFEAKYAANLVDTYGMDIKTAIKRNISWKIHWVSSFILYNNGRREDRSDSS